MLLATASSAAAATRSVAPAGVDQGDCIAAPCATLGYAYGRSTAGDVVAVAAGIYGHQSVPDGSHAVTFRGAAGATFRQLENNASNVTFDGIEVDANFAQTAGFQNHGAANVTFKNSRIGNVTDEKGALVSGTNFTFDNVLFHDVVFRTEGVHLECVYAIGVPGMVVRNSTFRDCAVMDLFFTYGSWWTPTPPAYGDVTIENNVFAHPEMANNSGWHYYSLYVKWTGNGGGSIRNWVVRHNTFESPATFDEVHETSTGSRWVGNLGSWNCLPQMAYSGNVGKRCSAADKQVSPAASTQTSVAPFGWLDPPSSDFRLKAGSPAIDAGNPGDAPATDSRGYARDSRPDAGAFEFGAGPGSGPGPGGTPTSKRLHFRSVQLKPRTICVSARRGCPAASRLRVHVSASARVSVRIKRLRAGHRPRLVRSFTFRVAAWRTARLSGERLGRGRFRVVVRAHKAGTRSRARAVTLLVR